MEIVLIIPNRAGKNTTKIRLNIIFESKKQVNAHKQQQKKTYYRARLNFIFIFRPFKPKQFMTY